jgi:protocatechuate 3,4-dioxygenase beta subunit
MVLVGSVLFQPLIGGAPVTGAIFTSLDDGSTTNHNLYDSKLDVYLNAGPGLNAPRDAAGLPDGDYYFQVTDPSGKWLLSTDPVKCRKFRVTDGVISEFLSQTTQCYKDGKQYGMHDIGDSYYQDAISIQLMPFDDTPNNGGVYKVWVTPIGEFTGDPEQVDSGGKFHGFVPRYCKTDNFKVKEQKPVKDKPEITIKKFEDLNGDGDWDAGEPALSGWLVYVTNPLGSTNNFWTDSNGCIVILAPLNGFYTIEEEVPEGWQNTALIVNGVVETPSTSVKITVRDKKSMSYEVIFGNFQCFEVEGYKYEDKNGNGQLDAGEPALQGWNIYLFHSTDQVTWTLVDTTQTDANGYYSFKVCMGGYFKVEEENVLGWSNTGPGYFTFQGISGTDRGPFVFLNFKCFTVDDKKYEDKIGNGVYDTGDTAIAGWQITLYKKNSAGGWTYVDDTVTGSNGYYSFKVCSPGEYKVEEELRLSMGWIPTGDAYYTFNGVSGESQTFNFFNFKTGCIKGFKWHDLNRNGVYDKGEKYLKGITIELYKNGVLFATTTTNGKGTYSFCSLGPGNYVVKEVLPPTGEPNIIWAQTYPGGDWVFSPFLSGSNILDANFGNIKEFTEGLTYGYWKTHTIYGPAAKPDGTYALLPTNPMDFDLPTSDNDYEIDSETEAFWVFNNCGSSDPPSASGDGRTLFRAQLMALHMNLLKFSNMGDMYYFYTGDTYSGNTVQEIYDIAIGLLTDGQPHDFHGILETIDRINNNGNYAPGSHVLFPDC